MAKKQALQLQIEINSEEEWELFLQREGLIVVDVFNEWAGPCSAMSGNLKKIKLEIGGDNIHLAQAKADKIRCLERFRKSCVPTWLFISNGKMVNLVFGANCPYLTNVVLEELKTEIAVREGTQTRSYIAEITDLTPEEQLEYDALKALQDEAEMIQQEKERQALYDRRLLVATHILENAPPLGVIVVFPHAKNKVKAALADLWEVAALAINGSEKPTLTLDIIEEMLFFAETKFNELELSMLCDGQCVAFTIKRTGDASVEDMDDTVLNFVYGEMKCPPGSPESPAEVLTTQIVIKKPEEPNQFTDLPQVPQLSKPTLGGDLMEGEMGEEAEEEEEVEVEPPETEPCSGLWAPPNPLTRATAIKLLFPKIYDPIALPEPVPIPPHIAIAFEVSRRREIIQLMETYESNILNYGFFTSDNPQDAKVLAKTIHQYDKSKEIRAIRDAKLVISLSRKPSEAWCVMSQYNPTFMSHDSIEGEKECKLFFPEDYDEGEEEEEELGGGGGVKVEVVEEAPEGEGAEAEGEGEGEAGQIGGEQREGE